MLKNKKYGGFTLLEMLVVVLIIGILAGIALPQYQMAVTKAKVASILPLMRRWKDALYEYKLQHGSYEDADADALGVSWTIDGQKTSDGLYCWGSSFWFECSANEDGESGDIYCDHIMSDESKFSIVMYQADEKTPEKLRGMTTCECETEGEESEKVCKALGGKLISGGGGWWGAIAYQLN